jgi:hypothetical protein
MYQFGTGSGSFELTMIVAPDDCTWNGVILDRGVYMNELEEGVTISLTAPKPYATFEWDGNTEGRYSLNPYYHVTDIVPEITEDVSARFIQTALGDIPGGQSIVSDDIVWGFDEGKGIGIYIVGANLISGGGGYAMVIPEPFTDPSSGSTVPAGVYLWRPNSGDVYVARLELYKE